MRTEFLCISVLRVASGPRVKLAGRKSSPPQTHTLPKRPPPPHPHPPLAVVYSTYRSKAVVPVLVLLFVALWFILRSDLFCLVFAFVLFYSCIFQPF